MGAPPKLLVLMWHHSILYRKSFITFVMPLCIPFIYVPLIYHMCRVDIDEYRPCSYLAESTLTDGPISAVVSQIYKHNITHVFDDETENKKMTSPFSTTSIKKLFCLPDALLEHENIRNVDALKDIAWREKLISIPISDYFDCRSSNKRAPKRMKNEGKNKKPIRNIICTVLVDKILYYPKTPITLQVMDNVSKKIGQFRKYFGSTSSAIQTKQSVTSSGATLVTNASSGSGVAVNSTLINIQSDDLIIKTLPAKMSNKILEFVSRLKETVKSPGDIVLGFDTIGDLQMYTQNLSKQSNVSYVPGVWGIVSFKDMPASFEDKNSIPKYSIIYDDAAGHPHHMDNEETFWLQDIIERSIIEVIARKTIPFSTVTKPNSSKCWNKPTRFNYIMIGLTIGVLLVCMFSTKSFLEQIMMEKLLKLREYLYIMGVGSMTLKLSWIIFYLIFILYATLAFGSVMVLLAWSNVFASTNSGFVLLLIVAFGVSYLLFVYASSNLLQSISSTVLLLFSNISFVVVTMQLFNVGMSPAYATYARLASFFSPVVPATIGIKYIFHWEMEWVGVQWKNLFMSPIENDSYSGLGEALAWLICSSVLYLILAEYLEKVFPGEFGIKLPFYFFLLPEYWSSVDSSPSPQLNETTADVEPNENKESGIVLDKLTKIYGNAKIALNQLSVIFYKGEITSFVGHNGAGKSTTLHCLAGLTTATRGTAFVNGLNLKTDMSHIRKSLGFVPQHDILYPDFTLEQHLQFFGWIKGMSKKDIQQTTDPLLSMMGMSGMKQQIITTLSGGQKKKLSLITGYLGSPNVILLDEPTSGVDPFSKRAIWGIILHHKENNTTLLSTHCMNEADVLADRVVIINDGELKCAGSPMYLKSKYGKGHCLTIARIPEKSERGAVIDFLNAQMPESKLVEELGNDMVFEISKEIAHSAKMIDLLENIEANMDSLGVLSYYLNEPTLDHVFIANTRMDTKVLHGDEATCDAPFSNELEYTTSNSLIQQAKALFWKRLLTTAKSPKLLAIHFAVPILFFGLMALLTMKEKVSDNGISITIPNNNYKQNVMFMIYDEDVNGTEIFLKNAFEFGNPPVCPGDACTKQSDVPSSMQNPLGKGPYDKMCETCETHCDKSAKANSEAHGVLPSGDKLFLIPNSVNITKWISLINQSFEIVIGGYKFNNCSASTLNQSSSADYVTLFYHPKYRQGVLNLWNTYLLRYMTDSGMHIELTIEGAKLTDQSARNIESEAPSSSSILPNLFVTLAIIVPGVGVLIVIHDELSSGMKHLQIIFGANPLVYWLVNLCFDTMLHTFTVIIIVITASTFENPFRDEVGYLMSIAIPFGMHFILFLYAFSILFSMESIEALIFSLINLTIMINLPMSLTSLPPCQFGSIFNFFNTIMSAMPLYLISDAISTMSYKRNAPPGFNKGLVDGECTDELSCVCYTHNLLSMDLLGQRILKTLVYGVVFMGVVMLLDYFDIKCSCSCLFKCCCENEAQAMNEVAAETDADVRREVERVQRLDNDNDSLVAMKLRKVHTPGCCSKKPNVIAVADITFGVAKSEIFGLLGVNGAGKSTTFGILTGYQKPTGGSAKILGQDLFSRSWGRFKDISYCPQENTLFPLLTVEQHLNLFAAIRGIPPDNIPELLSRLIEENSLEAYAGQKAGTLSGGNQRKLQFALAMLDYKPVIFLDEPTTGMDPLAQRQTWASIKRATKNGCTVVLTSHSMEECEALCHRLVIMVAGVFQCIGSVQYLKHKFGDKYGLKIKMDGQAAATEDYIRMTEFIKGRLPTCELVEKHSNMLYFDVLCSKELKLSYIFKTILESRQKFPIEDVSVSQTTLDQVFVNMSRLQSNQLRSRM